MASWIWQVCPAVAEKVAMAIRGVGTVVLMDSGLVIRCMPLILHVHQLSQPLRVVTLRGRLLGYKNLMAEATRNAESHTNVPTRHVEVCSAVAGRDECSSTVRTGPEGRDACTTRRCGTLLHDHCGRGVLPPGREGTTKRQAPTYLVAETVLSPVCSARIQ